jgi:hypothetical protein
MEFSISLALLSIFMNKIRTNVTVGMEIATTIEKTILIENINENNMNRKIDRT